MSSPAELPAVIKSETVKKVDSDYGEMADAVRQKSLQIFIQTVAEIEKILALDAEESASDVPPEITVAAMSALARSRASKQKTRHELATILATSALNNADNPHWNPFDSSTETGDAQPGGLLRQLLEEPDLPNS